MIATSRSALWERWQMSWLWVVVTVAIVVGGPFVLNLAGDAQVHLAIAENFAEGRPFRYNANGEMVVASTSPFWSLLLTTYYLLVGRWTPLLLSLTNLAIWLVSVVLLYRIAKAYWEMDGVALAAVVLLWLGHTTVVANALGGLENILSAMQLLLLYWLAARWRDGLTTGRSVWLGALAGWMLLTRPDGGLFGLLALGLYLLGNWPTAKRQWATFLVQLALIGAAAFVVLAPWYLYQYTITGRLVTDSSIARLYNGRQGSLTLISGFLYFHPKALVSLATAFLPLAAGYLVTSGEVLTGLWRTRRIRSAFLHNQYPQVTAVALVAAGFVFYSFVVGAEAFGRYFLPLYPFLFLTGVTGLTRVYQWLAAVGRRRSAVALIVLAVLFMAGTSAVDYYRRLIPGRFTINQALDVIYGPAQRQYYSVNLPSLIAAPRERPQRTDLFLHDLGAADESHVSIAVTEVQLRYFLDERVEVLSLDGRTSADILTYTDPLSGVPDFEGYFLATRPDFVHAKQWCAVGGWLAGVITLAIEDNLVCTWEKRAGEMALGDSFEWQGHQVELVAPEILQIIWRLDSSDRYYQVDQSSGGCQPAPTQSSRDFISGGRLRFSANTVARPVAVMPTT